MPLETLSDHLRLLTLLNLILILRIQNLEDVGGCQFGLIYIWEEVAVVANCYCREEDNVDCCEDVQPL